MNFLKDVLRDKKILEVDSEIETFIEENGISDNAIIYKIELGKERFQTEEEAREFLKSKWYYDYEIEESDSSFIASMISDKQIKQTDLKISLGREATAFIGDLTNVPAMEELTINDSGEIYFSTKFDNSEIKLSEDQPHIIEIARVAEGEHATFGLVKITEKTLESMELNFKDKVTGVDLSINEDHKKNEAFGWFKDVFRSQDGQRLFGQVVWNRKGTTALSEKEYRYFSPEFRFNYKHPHTGKEHGPTLLGGALTNYPFLKMEAIVELNNKQGDEIVSTISLKDHDAKVVELNDKLSSTQSELEAEKQKNIELSEKVNELTAASEKAAKEQAHQKLFDSEVINKNQLVALNEGKSMLEVLALGTKMNTSASGSGTKVEDDTIELSEHDKKMAEHFGLTEKEFIELNKEA